MNTPTERQLTPNQHTAIHDHERNLIVVAGAGSGKTFVLVERYLTLLDRHPDWPLNAVVAITFTKKAAQEMRDRVRQALEQRFNTATPDLQDMWAARMGAMESARIDTIHGLCASILRANAAEIGLDPGFEVLDEVDARILLDDSIDDVLQAIAHDGGPVIELFAEYDTQVIRQTVINLIAEEVPKVQADLMSHWQQLWEKNAARQIQELRTHPDYLSSTQWQPIGNWPNSSDKLMDVWAACHSLIGTLNDSEDTGACLETLARLINTINLRGGSTGAWGGKEAFDEAKAALKTLREIAQESLLRVGEPPGTVDQKTAQLLPLWTGLIQQAQSVYRSRKLDEGLLDFNDLERLTRDLLVHNSSVRERYQGTEFKHVLVDEFQDTNAVQWEIVRGLANIEQGGNLFVVGDPKQSIYQFRGADVSVFERVKGQITQAGGGDVPLSQSFRTHQTLVNGFNHLFGQLLIRDTHNPAFDYEVELGEVMQATRANAPSDAAPIEVLYIDKNLSEEKLDSEAVRRWEAYEVATRLKTIVEDEKRPIYDKGQRIVRPIGYGDIAILYQSMSNILLYEDVFKTARLPFVTVAGRGYYSRQEVWDLLNLLTALHNPGDNLALASALRSPLFGLSDDALLALRLQRDPKNSYKRLPLYEALRYTVDIAHDEQERVRFAQKCLSQLRAIAGRVSIADLLEAALDETGYLATLTGLPDGARRRGNIEKLLDKAQESRQVTLGAFSQYLRDLTTREVREGEALVDIKDSVTLMTVHASKGLEYPLVALVDIGWSKGNSSGDPVMFDPSFGLVCKVYDPNEEKLISGYAHNQAERFQRLREIAERKRLLYVAATRAQDYLLLSGQSLRNAKDTWLNWIDNALELSDVLAPGTVTVERAWGNLHIRVPEHLPTDDLSNGDEKSDANLWSHPQVQAGAALPGGREAPLTVEIRLEPRSALRHITATQIADAGSARFDPDYKRRFRRSVLHDAPLTIDQISIQKMQEVSQRIIGEMVHKVLGWWQFDAQNNNLDGKLDSYAWELGVVDEGKRKYAIQEAHKLITKMRSSPIFGWLQEAQQMYREIAFVYRSEKRIIHGVLDVLFQRQDGSWVILDYKTSHVKGYKPGGDERLLSSHALRYHLQIGVYGAAIQEQLGGIVPETYIYYIRYGQYVRVEKSEWSEAIEKFEATIGDLLAE